MNQNMKVVFQGGTFSSKNGNGLPDLNASIYISLLFAGKSMNFFTLIITKVQTHLNSSQFISNPKSHQLAHTFLILSIKTTILYFYMHKALRPSSSKHLRTFLFIWFLWHPSNLKIKDYILMNSPSTMIRGKKRKETKT